MAVDVSIQVEGLDQLFAKLDKLAANEVLKPPMEASLISLYNYMADETPGPPQRPYPKMLRTAKQRRYFFWALAQGIIKVPYQRSGKMQQNWTWEMETLADGLHGKVGNNYKPTRYVQSEAFQARIHQGNWQTDADAIRGKRDEIIQRFRSAVSEALKK